MVEPVKRNGTLLCSFNTPQQRGKEANATNRSPNEIPPRDPAYNEAVKAAFNGRFRRWTDMIYQSYRRSGDRQCLVLLSIPAFNKIFYVYDARFFLWIGMNTAGICGTTCKMQLDSIQNFQVKGVFEVCMPWCQMTNWSLKDLEILYSTGITVPASSNWPVWVHAAADVANSKLQIRIETVPQETHPITDKCSMHGSGQFGSLSEPTRFRRRLSMMQS